MPVITRKGQVTIPKEIRDKLGIALGSEVKFELEADKCILKKKNKKSPFDKWTGYLQNKETSDKILENLRGDKK
ncbi:MAG: AbrB/MazE/SpoVT family DNA-binding domain-containing protein [Candidatus Firestonebacteria bacterium]|nr:AbrB/MazE/SpoVT family DNA-binding domain-containing protein [Candidatus Firestonebacteria bacterium]